MIEGQEIVVAKGREAEHAEGLSLRTLR